jgi:hypothetical protein
MGDNARFIDERQVKIRNSKQKGWGHGVHFLLTWNCAHIANAETIEEIQEICAENTFQCPVICTPEELLGG